MDMLVSVLVKLKEVPEAIRKAIEDAKKTLLKFQLVVLQFLTKLSVRFCGGNVLLKNQLKPVQELQQVDQFVPLLN